MDQKSDQYGERKLRCSRKALIQHFEQKEEGLISPAVKTWQLQKFSVLINLFMKSLYKVN